MLDVSRLLGQKHSQRKLQKTLNIKEVYALVMSSDSVLHYSILSGIAKEINNNRKICLDRPREWW